MNIKLPACLPATTSPPAVHLLLPPIAAVAAYAAGFTCLCLPLLASACLCLRQGGPPTYLHHRRGVEGCPSILRQRPQLQRLRLKLPTDQRPLF